MFWKNERGMTLVEVMVAAGLLGGLAIAGVSLFNSQNKSQKTVEQNYDATSISNEIRDILKDGPSCFRNFGNLNPTTATVMASGVVMVKNGSDFKTVYAPNASLPGTKLKVISYSLNASTPGLQTNETMLIIRFQRSDSALQAETPRFVKIAYTNAIAPATGIGTCTASSTGGASDLWQISTVEPTDIYYNKTAPPAGGGQVGIGTPDPQRQLHVVGPIRLAPSVLPTTGLAAGDMAIDSANNNTLKWYDGTRWQAGGGVRYPQDTTYGMSMAAGINALNSQDTLTNANYKNTAYGYLSMQAISSTAAVRNTAVGSNSQQNLSTGSDNVTMGVEAGVSISTGTENVAIGNTAGAFIYGGTQNVAIGNSAFFGNGNNSTRNVAVGYWAMQNSANGGDNNVALGAFAGSQLNQNGMWPCGGCGNTLVGYGAGAFITTGNYNIFLGHQDYSGPTNNITTGNNNILIGHDVRPQSNTASNQMNIGNLIYATGLGENATTATSGKVGIGIASPEVNLDVQANSATDASYPIIRVRNTNPTQQAGVPGNANYSALMADAGNGTVQGDWLAAHNAAGLPSGMYLRSINNHPIHFVPNAVAAAKTTMTMVGYNVGIGTSNPTSTLHVVGGAGTIMRIGGNRNWDIVSDDNPDSFQIRNQTDASFRAFTITSTNNVGISHTAPVYTLDVNGTVRATSYIYSSDKRLKHDVKDYKNGLGQVLKLRGVTFTWNKDDKQEVGFIAQEVEKVEPLLVATDVTGMKSVKYGNIVALVVEAIQDLHQMILKLVSSQNEHALELATIKKENALLKSRLDHQESRMKAQETTIAELLRKSKK